MNKSVFLKHIYNMIHNYAGLMWLLWDCKKWCSSEKKPKQPKIEKKGFFYFGGRPKLDWLSSSLWKTDVNKCKTASVVSHVALRTELKLMFFAEAFILHFLGLTQLQFTCQPSPNSSNSLGTPALLRGVLSKVTERGDCLESVNFRGSMFSIS